jgi:WD40 repeat protein
MYFRRSRLWIVAASPIVVCVSIGVIIVLRIQIHPQAVDGMIESFSCSNNLLTKEQNCLAISPNGDRIVSGGYDSVVRIWDYRNRKLVLEFTKHTDGVLCVAFSADGTRIASAGKDSTLHVWSANHEGEVYTYKGNNAWISSVLFLHHGKSVAFSDFDGVIRVWDFAQGKITT